MSSKAYVPPHRRRQNNVPPAEKVGNASFENPGALDNVDILCRAFDRVCCINLKRRGDRWKMFRDRMTSCLGHRDAAFVAKVERFEAVDGAALLASENYNEDQDLPCQEWNASNNALYDRHIQPPMEKLMTPGEVGCAMSHVKLWRQLATQCIEPDSTATMLILEDDATFYKAKNQHRNNNKDGGRDWRDMRKSKTAPGFMEAFACMWKTLPQDWDILYLGLSDRGERLLVEGVGILETSQEDIEITIFRPTYGFHTHAYALKASAAATLLSYLPVVGPLDVWLADNHWFGLNVYCAVVSNEGWHGQGASLIGQRRHDTKSDIRQSGRVG